MAFNAVTSISLDGTDIKDVTQALTNKTIDVDSNTVSNIETDNFKANVVDTDGTLAENSDTRLVSQKAINTAINSRLAGLSYRPAVDLKDDTATDAGTEIVGQTTYDADSITLVNGDRLLLTAEATAPATYQDRVFVVSGVGSAIVLTLALDGQAGDGSPTDGDTIFVQRGTASGDKTFTYNGTDFVLSASLNGALLASNNLSDVLSASTSATNLGLGTGNSPSLTGLTLSGLTTAGGLVQTDGSGVLSSSTDIPTANTIGTKYIYRAEGTDVAVADGGTNISSYAIGDLLYASTTGVLSKLADVAVGQVLVSGGVGVAPAYSASPVLTNIEIASADAFYYGDKTTEGSWRTIRADNDLEFQRYESEVWVKKAEIVAA